MSHEDLSADTDVSRSVVQVGLGLSIACAVPMCGSSVWLQGHLGPDPERVIRATAGGEADTAHWHLRLCLF